MRFEFVLVFASLLLLSCRNEPLGIDVQSPPTVYLSHCASCHGQQLEGASATSLIKETWYYGQSSGKMRQNIKYGIASAEMPAFEHILTDQTIDTLVDFLVAVQDLDFNKKAEIPDQIEVGDYTLKIEPLGQGKLKIPWAIEFVDHTTALVSGREGTLHWLVDGEVDTQYVNGLPVPHTASSTGGFMDIGLDPDWEIEPWIYLAYSHTDGNPQDKEAPALTKIVRGKIVDHTWRDQETLFEAPPDLRPIKGNRWGSRLIFDDQKRLYFTIGDMALAEDSQDLTKATGKVFRINRDGSIPEDNPYLDVPEALPQIFTIGNRNTQGLAWHPVTGELWSTDHGPMGGDELNVLESGKNYGWPTITYGRDYSGDIVSDSTHKHGLQQPVWQWTPSPGVCPIEFCTSPLFPLWTNRLLLGALGLQELSLIQLQGQNVISQELILKNIGRIRDVKFAPDGSLFVVVNGPDVVLRLTPNELLR